MRSHPPRAADLPSEVDVHETDRKMVQQGHDRFLKERGLYWESPLARHHRRRREAKLKASRK